MQDDTSTHAAASGQVDMPSAARNGTGGGGTVLSSPPPFDVDEAIRLALLLGRSRTLIDLELDRPGLAAQIVREALTR